MPEALEAPVRAIAEAKAKMRPRRAASVDYDVTIDATTDPDDLFRPEFWKHMAHLFKKDWDNDSPVDVRCRSEDRSWRWDVEVHDVGPHHVLMKPLGPICRYDYRDGLDMEVKEPVPEGYSVRYSPAIGYWVRRLADKERIGEGFKTSAAAKRWLAAYLEKIAA